MAAVAQRDPRALEAVYDRYGSVVYSLARRLLGDPHRAEDVVQDIFLRLWDRPQLYVASRGQLLTWLLTLTRNRAIDQLRAQGRRQRFLRAPAGAQVETQDPVEQAQWALERHQVLAALTHLPPEQREAIELAYFRGLTHREIAEATGLPLGTVKTRIRLAMQKLRAMLLEED
ncbi:ECF RNA polymerase sigma factor SigK [bacterium HR24]|mgnify:FL=1|jgi:RNA polymerase sigma-70 factor (ECF subfamily)|nr:ECF RNA polymerase sigma factor SigK [bacterium HR24]